MKVASGIEDESEKKIFSFDEMSVGTFKLMEPVIASGNQPYSLLGAKFLKFGKITFNFGGERFYFEPYETIKNAEPIKSAGFDLRIEKEGFFVGCIVGGFTG